MFENTELEIDTITEVLVEQKPVGPDSRGILIQFSLLRPLVNH